MDVYIHAYNRCAYFLFLFSTGPAVDTEDRRMLSPRLSQQGGGRIDAGRGGGGCHARHVSYGDLEYAAVRDYPSSRSIEV